MGRTPSPAPDIDNLEDIQIDDEPTVQEVLPVLETSKLPEDAKTTHTSLAITHQEHQATWPLLPGSRGTEASQEMFPPVLETEDQRPTLPTGDETAAAPVLPEAVDQTIQRGTEAQSQPLYPELPLLSPGFPLDMSFGDYTQGLVEDAQKPVLDNQMDFPLVPPYLQEHNVTAIQSAEGFHTPSHRLNLGSTVPLDPVQVDDPEATQEPFRWSQAPASIVPRAVSSSVDMSNNPDNESIENEEIDHRAPKTHLDADRFESPQGPIESNDQISGDGGPSNEIDLIGRHESYEFSAYESQQLTRTKYSEPDGDIAAPWLDERAVEQSHIGFGDPAQSDDVVMQDESDLQDHQGFLNLAFSTKANSPHEAFAPPDTESPIAGASPANPIDLDSDEESDGHQSSKPQYVQYVVEDEWHASDQRRANETVGHAIPHEQFEEDFGDSSLDGHNAISAEAIEDNTDSESESDQTSAEVAEREEINSLSREGQQIVEQVETHPNHSPSPTPQQSFKSPFSPRLPELGEARASDVPVEEDRAGSGDQWTLSNKENQAFHLETPLATQVEKGAAELPSLNYNVTQSKESVPIWAQKPERIKATAEGSMDQSSDSEEIDRARRSLRVDQAKKSDLGRSPTPKVPPSPSTTAAEVGRNESHSDPRVNGEPLTPPPSFPQPSSQASDKSPTAVRSSPVPHVDRAPVPPPERLPTPPPFPSHGIRTSTSYYTSLTSLPQHVSQPVDVLATVVYATTPQRAPNGRRDYHQTLFLLDPALLASAPKNPSLISAQVFRPYRKALPTPRAGDVLLLREFKVIRRNGKAALISADASAWAVFKGQTGEAEVKGPPVEWEEEEVRVGEQLRVWWERVDRELKEKLAARVSEEAKDMDAKRENNKKRDSGKGKGTAPNSSATETGTSQGAARESRHELRNGTVYSDRPRSSKGGQLAQIHELRDGTTYRDGN